MIGRLYINGQEVDLNEAVPFPLNFSIADVRNPEKRKRNFSKTLALPGTANNRDIFASARMLSIADLDGVTGFQFDPTVRTPAEYYRGNLRIFSGLCELQDVERVGDMFTFNINLLSSFVDLFQSLGNLKVNELGWDEYDHTLGYGFIEDSWDTEIIKNGSPVANFSGGVPLGFGYLYGLANWGYNQFDTIFKTTDVILQVYAKEIWDKCFARVGLTYSSTFINSELFRRIVIGWEGGSKIGISATEAAARNVDFDAATVRNGTFNTTSTVSFSNITGRWRAQYILNNLISWPAASITVNNDPINQYQSATKSITVGRKGKYRLLVTGKLGGSWAFNTSTDWTIYAPSVANTFLNILFEVQKNNWPQTVNQIQLIHGGAAAYTTFAGTLDFDCEVGDIISFKILSFVNISFVEWTGSQISPTFDIALDNDGSDLNINLVALDTPLTDGDTVNVSRFVTEMKAVDFMKSIITMFNLYITEPNEQGVCAVAPLEDFYSGNLPRKRMRSQVDYSRPQKIIPTSEIEGKIYAFRWKEDADFYNARHRELYGNGYGNYEYEVQSTFQQGERVYGVAFAQSIPVEYQQGGFILPQIIKYDATTGLVSPFKGSPRIFMYNGLKSGSWRLANDVNYDPSNSGTYQDYTTYPQLNHLWDLAAANFDLNFGIPTTVYWAATNYTNNNLWKRHERFIRELTGRDSKLWQLYMKWTDDEIAQLDFARPIEIDGVIYRLNKIVDFDPDKDETTMTELVKIVEIEAPAILSYADFEIEIPPGDLLEGGDTINGSDTAPDLITGGDMTVESSTDLRQMR
jgi:hypothetical protein